MDTNSLIKTYSTLGLKLLNLSQDLENSPYAEQIDKALIQNLWFTKESITMALSALGNSLQADKIATWINKYDLSAIQKNKTIGIVMAGNLPLVGFHDLLCTLVSGNNILAKLSSKDQVLYSVIKAMLIEIDTQFESRIQFTEDALKNIDAIIATGSDNSARYFEYYFNKYPNIIRKNRNSVCILSGNETKDELEKLGEDIFSYFGLGCRNVSLLLVPENYNFTPLFEALEKYNSVANHNKYYNNYTYQKAILMMNQIPLFDNGFVLLKEDNTLSSPIGTLHYTYYKSEEITNNYIMANKHKIQCVVSKTNWSFHTYGLGEAQQPELWDYADNVDTLSFLLNLK